MEVYGKVNGIEVSFKNDSGNNWLATVPNCEGDYYIELMACDEAGNSSYFATILLTYDTSTMCFCWKITDVSSRWKISDVKMWLKSACQV